jgi:prolipoprotein diacylglyceryl transferase
MMQWTWDVHPMFQIFGMTFRYYSVFFFATLVGGWALLRWQILRGGGREHDADFILGLSILGIWLGGRLVHLLFYDFSDFVADPGQFFELKKGGLASHGAAIGLMVALWVFSRWRKVSLLDACDRGVFSVALAGILIRIGNFFNSEIVGRLTDQTWGVRFARFDRVDPPLRHPSQLYEVGLGVAVMLLLWVVDRRLGESRPRGLMLSLLLMSYFGGRFLIEFFKDDDLIAQGWPLTTGQLLSIVPFLLGVVGWRLARTRQLPATFKPESSL